MKAIAMVAHPDDCVIFAYSFIHAHPGLEWTICYLTREDSDYRAKEIKDFWHRRGIPTKFLGYKDNWRDIENKQISFDEARAWIDIQEAVSDNDIVLTHNQEGDYGHIHHKFVHAAVADWHPNIVTFAGQGQGNIKYTLPAGTYTLDELPTHQAVITSFHQQQHANEYFIPDPVKELLNKS